MFYAFHVTMAIDPEWTEGFIWKRFLILFEKCVEFVFLELSKHITVFF